MFHRTRLYPIPWQRYRLGCFLVIISVVGWVATLSLGAVPLSAHGGGVPRLTDEVAGPYRIFAWTQPEPLRVGDIHLSIAVVEGARNADRAADSLDVPVTDATVTVYLLPVTQDRAPLILSAVLQEQLGSYYYEADATLPTSGVWRFTIEVSGNGGAGRATFVGQVLPARQLNWPLVITAGVLLLGLLVLIGLWNRMQAKASAVSHTG